MSKTYFMSDVHLGLGARDAEREKESRLLSFFDFIKQDANHLFIVGDLFDAWFEYKTVIPKGFHRTLTKLEEIVQRKITVHYLAGNHDYWMGEFFREELGIKIYHEPFDITIEERRIFLHHGDGLAHNDTGYRILKKILRYPFNIKLYKMLHPDIGLSLAKTSSKKSRHYTASKHYGEEDGMIEFAQGKINEGFDAVIMGHRHVPNFKQFGNGVYINLGDWISHCTYAVLHDGKFELKRWNE
ncbi:MAG: UDP-2,3-diacylglucosamine diphosphatase [Ignavibacteriales bacterium]|nr:UDP-2,3-diacylglucosamine diphosphatase [Ignavibacteriales bacterium]